MRWCSHLGSKWGDRWNSNFTLQAAGSRLIELGAKVESRWTKWTNSWIHIWLTLNHEAICKIFICSGYCFFFKKKRKKKITLLWYFKAICLGTPTRPFTCQTKTNIRMPNQHLPDIFMSGITPVKSVQFFWSKERNAGERNNKNFSPCLIHLFHIVSSVSLIPLYHHLQTETVSTLESKRTKKSAFQEYVEDLRDLCKSVREQRGWGSILFWKNGHARFFWRQWRLCEMMDSKDLFLFLFLLEHSVF